MMFRGMQSSIVHMPRACAHVILSNRVRSLGPAEIDIACLERDVQNPTACV